MWKHIRHILVRKCDIFAPKFFVMVCPMTEETTILFEK